MNFVQPLIKFKIHSVSGVLDKNIDLAPSLEQQSIFSFTVTLNYFAWFVLGRVEQTKIIL